MSDCFEQLMDECNRELTKFNMEATTTLDSECGPQSLIFYISCKTDTRQEKKLQLPSATTVTVLLHATFENGTVPKYVEAEPNLIQGIIYKSMKDSNVTYSFKKTDLHGLFVQIMTKCGVKKK